MTVCNCDLRVRRWNPGTRRCETCGDRYPDRDESAPPSPPMTASPDELIEMVNQTVQMKAEARNNKLDYHQQRRAQYMYEVLVRNMDWPALLARLAADADLRRQLEGAKSALQACVAEWGKRDAFLLPAETAALVLARSALASLPSTPAGPTPATATEPEAAKDGFWKGKRYTIAVDFDGVLHRYDTPWIDDRTIPDPPVAGALEWLREIARKFDVVIFTTRAASPEGIEAVEDWFRKHGYVGPPVRVSAVKPPALVYIDDRAWRFDGKHFPTASEIHAARPWHKVSALTPPPRGEQEAGHTSPTQGERGEGEA